MIEQFVINGIIAGSIYGLTSLGFVTIYRTVSFFNFSHGMVYTIGAYLSYTLLPHFPVIIAFILATLLSGILGTVIDRLIYYPLRKHKASSFILLITSFGVFTFLQNLVQLIYGSNILTFKMGSVEEGNRILGAIVTNNQIIIVLVSLLLSIFLSTFIQQTKIGKSMRAVADDPIAAGIVGINPEKTIAISFFIGSALAGAAGILISLETNLEPTMGLNAILKGIIASIIGGIGSIPGALLGGLFLGLAENLGTYWIDAAWKDTIAFGILIVFLLFKPTGILGKPTGKERL
jgi:branched-chain amino acid transport system permease protein